MDLIGLEQENISKVRTSPVCSHGVLIQLVRTNPPVHGKVLVLPNTSSHSRFPPSGLQRKHICGLVTGDFLTTGEEPECMTVSICVCVATCVPAHEP